MKLRRTDNRPSAPAKPAHPSWLRRVAKAIAKAVPFLTAMGAAWVGSRVLAELRKAQGMQPPTVEDLPDELTADLFGLPDPEPVEELPPEREMTREEAVMGALQMIRDLEAIIHEEGRTEQSRVTPKELAGLERLVKEASVLRARGHYIADAYTSAAETQTRKLLDRYDFLE
jgi:hypothetical protein